MPKTNQKSSDTTGISVSTDPQAVPEKKRGRPKGSKNKTIRSDRTILTEPGENTRYLNHDIKLMNLPQIDINNVEQVKQRIQDYFQICSQDDIRPSVASLALAFHVSRFVLFDMLNERNNTIKRPECIHTIKTAYDMINSYYEHMMNNGKINPVAGIFLMKNNMGYKDTTDYIVTTGNNTDPSLQDISDKAGLLTD